MGDLGWWRLALEVVVFISVRLVFFATAFEVLFHSALGTFAIYILHCNASSMLLIPCILHICRALMMAMVVVEEEIVKPHHHASFLSLFATACDFTAFSPSNML